MNHKAILALALAAIGVSVSVPANAGSGGVVGSGMGTRAPIGVTAQLPKIDRPSVPFTKMKLLNCDKYPRGNGQGGVIWVTVCS